MKKIKYIFLVLISLFLFIPTTDALYGNTFSELDRSVKENLGVNKKWNINDKNKDNVLNTPLVDADEKIYDYSNVLTDDEVNTLKEKSLAFLKNYNMEMIIVTINLPYTIDSYNETFAADFYDYNDFGLNLKYYDGILLVRNTYEMDPYYDIYTFGEARMYFDQSRYDEILDDIYDELHNGEYLNGFSHFINIAEDIIKRGKSNEYQNAYMGENNEILYRYNLSSYIGVISIISAVITAIYFFINRAKNKMIIKATNANDYVDKGSFVLTNNQDQFVTSHTTSYTVSSSSGGGGGSGSSFGSSGGGHSSGGGRHG